jgi:hypothetical protein
MINKIRDIRSGHGLARQTRPGTEVAKQADIQPCQIQQNSFTDTRMWALSYDEDLQDTIALQSKVARDIAGQIRVTLNSTGTGGAGEVQNGESGGLSGLPQRMVLLGQANRRCSEESHRVF